MRLPSIMVAALSCALLSGVFACGGGNSGYLPPVSSPLVPYEPPEVARDDGAGDDEEDFGVEPEGKTQTPPATTPKPATPTTPAKKADKKPASGGM